MDNQDQRRAHTPGHESHGVHLCHKCGWPFPNPHPSAKHRRAHKKICGTIEGYKLSVSEGHINLNGSDDEHASDDDHKTSGLVVSGPNAVDSGNNENGNDVIREKSIRSEDEMFSDAVADFSDSGLSQGIRECSQADILDSGTNVERVGIKDPKLSGSSGGNYFNADVSQLTFKSSDDFEIQNPKVLQSETVEIGNTLELQGQLSGSTADTSSIEDLRAEELKVMHIEDSFGLLGDSCPSKAESLPDENPENKIYTGENVTDCSLTADAKETNLKRKDEIKSDGNEVEIVVPSDDVVGETFEGESKIAVSDSVHSDHQVADAAVDLKEMNSAEFLSVLAQDDDPVELNSVGVTNASTNDFHVEFAHVIQFATSSDVNVLQEKEEGNVDVDTPSTRDDRPVAHPLSECEDFKQVVVLQIPLSLHSSESLKHEEDDLKDTVTEENNSVCNPGQLTEKSDVLYPDMDVVDNSSRSSMKKELVNREPMPEEMHAEDSTDVIPVKRLKPMVESYGSIDEIGVSMNAVKTEMNESHMLHFSDKQGPDDVHKYSQQISLPEDSLMTLPNENLMNASFGSLTSETTGVISIDNISHHEKNITEIHDVAVDGKDVGANVENDIGSKTKDFQPSDLQLEVRQPRDLFKSGDAGEMDKCDITDAECRETPTAIDSSLSQSAGSLIENPVISEPVTDGYTGKSKCIECTDIGPMSGAQEDTKEDEINSNIKVHQECERSVHTSADSHQAPDADLVISEAVIGGSTGKPKGVVCTDIGPISGAQEDPKEDEINSSIRVHEECERSVDISADSHQAQEADPVISEAVVDGSTGKSKGVSTDIGPISGAQEDTKEDEINSSIRVHEECERSVDTSADSHQAPDAELLVKAAEDLSGKHGSLPPLNTEPSAQHDSAGGDNQDGERGREVSGITAVPVQDQSANNLVKHISSGIDASVDSGSRCDSLEGNWGSVSVLSMQSDAPVATDTETLQSTGSLASTEVRKSNLNNAKAASERQQSGKSEMFEAPSFMTLIEPAHGAGPKGSASEILNSQNPQQPSSPSQAGWFPTLTQVINDSQGKKKNKEIIAKVTNWSASKEHTPLKSLLGEAAHSNKPKSPKMEEYSVNKKSGKIPENNGSTLTTVNSILGPESPAAQALKDDAAKEWNSPARYPADIKREKRKVKSRPLWIQLVCCSTVDPQRR